MTEKLNIIAVIGDLGGTTEMLLVAKALEPVAEVTWVSDPDGKGKDLLAKAGMSWVGYDPQSGELPFCDLVVVGTSATAVGAQVGLTRAAVERNVPVLWVEDLYGTASHPAVRSAREDGAPDAICVIDHVAAEIARRTWPKPVVIPTGKPSWSEFAALTFFGRADVRGEVRHRLGVAEDELLLTCWHGGQDVEVEKQVLQTLGACRNVPRLRLAVRPHPKLGAAVCTELRAWAAGLGGFVCAGAEGIVPAEKLAVASDMAVAGWGGTQGYVSVIAGIPTIVPAFGAAREKMLALHYPDGLPPHVFAGAARIAWTSAELGSALSDLLARREQIATETLARAAPLRRAIDPAAAKNIADVAVTLATGGLD